MDFDLPNLTVHQLAYVKEAVRHKTLTEAADELGVTQSALSQGLAEVERRLGIRLFEKHGRTKQPTAALRDVADVAQQVIALTHDLQQRMNELVTGQRGDLRLGLIDTVALGSLAEPVRTYRASHPNVKTTITVAPSLTLTRMVGSGDLDLAVVVVPNAATNSSPNTFRIKPFTTESIYVYAPTEMATTEKSPTKWGPWVSYPAGSQSRERIEQALVKLGAPLETVAESSNPDVLRQMVRLGVGWCALPEDVAEGGPHPLRRVTSKPLTTRELGFVTRRSALDNAALDEFLAMCTPTPVRRPISSKQPHRRTTLNKL